MKIKFVTLNIWEGGKLLDPVVSFIKKDDPDIIVMQEVCDSENLRFEKRLRTMDIFKKELEFPHYVFSKAFIKTLSIGRIKKGNAVFSKFPVSGREVIFFDVPFGIFDSEHSSNFQLIPSVLQHAVVTLDGVDVNIFNVHGIWGLDGNDNEKRLKMSKIIANEIKDKENVILAGDFNVQPSTKTVQNIEKYLKNVFKDELKTTFNMKRKDNNGYATAVVDMVFVSKNIKIIDCSCPQVDISDHLPLVCALEL